MPILFVLISLACGFVWLMFPGQVTWLPVVVIVLPWLVWWRNGRFSLPATPFSGLLLLFFGTALFAVWTAYDRGQAEGKLWILIGALFVFISLAALPRHTEHWGGALLWGIAVGLAVYFLLTHNWQQWPTDFNVLTRLGVWWMGKRPLLTAPPLHPNLVGGVIATFAPLGMALVWQTGRPLIGKAQTSAGTWLALVGILLANGIMFFALLLSSSRAAWVALIVSYAVIVGWWGSLRILQSRRMAISRTTLAVLFILIMVGIGVLPIVGIMLNMSGGTGSTGRFVLYKQTWRLIQVCFFTGAGLASFGGFYAQYIQVVPHFVLSYAHNLFLDVWLEQGVIGFLSFTVFMVGTGWMLFAHIFRLQIKKNGSTSEVTVWHWAVAVGLVTMLLHGLLDDSFYGTIRISLISAPTTGPWSGVLATPLFLAMPGLATALVADANIRWTAVFRPVLLFVGVVALVGAAWLVLDRDTVEARWQANLGALSLARAQLSGWPTNVWDDGRQAVELAPVAAQLANVLDLDADNVAAQYRLGLIAMLERDYETAVSHLEIAHELDPGHRGITKNLGYCYVWLGEFDKARLLLANISETQQEMSAYEWWWQQQGRPDLAERAAQMSQP
ncbi:MAG: O-antigen ligase family protein [Anaerolineales bacterium]|nr:O-antigen ligase family protein [Anaerolineales bacterium]